MKVLITGSIYLWKSYVVNLLIIIYFFLSDVDFYARNSRYYLMQKFLYTLVQGLLRKKKSFRHWKVCSSGESRVDLECLMCVYFSKSA